MPKAPMQKDGYQLYYNQGGPAIGTAGVPVIERDGLYFRDLARTGELLPYEDWRLPAADRAEDLAARLTIRQIAGLMMYSPHQMVPFHANGPFAATYAGASYEESGAEPWALTDQQREFLDRDGIRHVLVMTQDSTEAAVRWNNAVQSYVEALPFGIPVNFSSDPRHGASAAASEYKTQAGALSKWPESLGMAATFDPNLCRRYGEIVAKEYRALGICTALGPQIDVGTDPRWLRLEDTFGASPDLVTAMGKSYCDGLQTTEGSRDGWGADSVCAMVKHWPGGGPCEAGRDAHYPFGKYSVYPGNALDRHLKPFLDGAFRLDGPTGQAAAVMPYYSVPWNVDPENVGNSYSRRIIRDMLRDQYGYDGVVCTDWGITGDPEPDIDSFGARCYGVEALTEAERHLRIIENGVDQFGGNSRIEPILEAYRLGCETYGETAMRARMERSAVRLLLNLFRCGLFENPYLDLQESLDTVGAPEYTALGFEAQLRSVVLLKNSGVLPLPTGKAYIPGRRIGPRKNFFRFMDAERALPGAAHSITERFYGIAETPEEADFALLMIESPLSDGYDAQDAANGGNGYRPISLQYRPYRADEARAHSIAGGDFRESFTDRGYRGKTGCAANESDLDLVIETKRRMGSKPVVVCLRIHNPVVMAELEPYADVLIADFGVQQEALLEVISGRAKPGGRLPVQLPKDMAAVERHCEDLPLDIEPYTDTAGNRYDFGFGLTEL